MPAVATAWIILLSSVMCADWLFHWGLSPHCLWVVEIFRRARTEGGLVPWSWWNQSSCFTLQSDRLDFFFILLSSICIDSENGAEMHGSLFHWSEVFCLCGWWFTHVRRRPLPLIGCNYLFPLIPGAHPWERWPIELRTGSGHLLFTSLQPFSHPPSPTLSRSLQTPPQPSVCININNGAWRRKWNCAPPAQRRQDARLHLKGAAASPRLTNPVVWW